MTHTTIPCAKPRWHNDDSLNDLLVELAAGCDVASVVVSTLLISGRFVIAVGDVIATTMSDFCEEAIDDVFAVIVMPSFTATADDVLVYPSATREKCGAIDLNVVSNEACVVPVVLAVGLLDGSVKTISGRVLM
jgi:uncharacterized membrane protein YiaA